MELANIFKKLFKRNISQNKDWTVCKVMARKTKVEDINVSGKRHEHEERKCGTCTDTWQRPREDH